MDDAELQLRLCASRPHGQDAEDPLMRAALEALPRHPGLKEWHERQTAFDRAMCGHVGSIPVPAGLCSEILAALKVSRARRRVVLPWLAAAAMLAAAALVFWSPQNAGTLTLAEAQTEIVRIFDRMQTEGFSLDHVSDELAEVSTWLADEQAPLPYVVQAGMKDSQPMGCRIVSWRGGKVTMICFRKGGDSAHLFVVDRVNLAEGEGPHSRDPGPVRHVEGRPVSAWGCRKCLYVLVGGSKDTRLDDFL